MGKKKKLKRGNLSEKANDKRIKKKSDRKGKVNPFELRHCRQKHEVVGQKAIKKGRPGIARARAIEKRKATLLVEYKKLNKANRFIDHRFGEYDTNVTPEEKMMQRFSLERKKMHTGKPELFSLNDAEDLTHYGQSLADIETFEKPLLVESDDEGGSDLEDGDKGKLSADYTSRVHFGGGMLTRKEDWQGGGPGSGKGTKSHKEIIEEMIAKTRQMRYEAQREKEATDDLTQQLDDSWRTLRGVVAGGSKKVAAHDTEPHKVKGKEDDYDKLVQQLRFEARGTPTDRLKTEEELANEERDKLEMLEKDRQRRMLGIVGGSEADVDGNCELDASTRAGRGQKHVSFEGHMTGDDEGNGRQGKKEWNETLIYYDMDGNLKHKKMGDSGEENDGNDEDEDSVDEGQEDSGGDEESDDEVGQDSGDDEVDDDDEVGEVDEERKEKEDEVNNEDSGSTQSSEDDNFSDIASDGADDDDDDVDENHDGDSKEMTRSILKTKAQVRAGDVKSMMEQARSQMPFVFKLPSTYADLESLMSKYSIADRQVVLDRMYKCNHPSVVSDNKENLKVYFSLLLHYFVSADVAREESLLNSVTSHLHQLARHFPVFVAKHLQNIFRQRFQEKVKSYPNLSTLLYLKLVSSLFETSDRHHPLVIPSLLYMCRLISHVPCRSRRDVAANLYLTSLILEYVTYSRRFVPEALNNLYNLITLAAVKPAGEVPRFQPPVKPVGEHVDVLLIKHDCTRVNDQTLAILKELPDVTSDEQNMSDEIRVHMLAMCLRLTKHFSLLYMDLPAYSEIFSPLLESLGRLPSAFLPSSVKILKDELIQAINARSKKPRKKLLAERPKPKQIKFMEPKIEENFDASKRRSKGNKDLNEGQRLSHKYKREMKSAVREIKKDSQFLAREKLKEQFEKDAERREKVKRIYSLLANQEGDCRKIKKQKLKIKF